MVSDTQILAVHGLRIESVGGEVLVDGVDLQLADGDRLGLLGMSGSGKSLTALALIDLLPPGVRRVAGSIKLGGQEVTGFDDAAWCQFRGRRIGFIFQDPSTAFNPVLRIGLQVGEALEVHRPEFDPAARRQRVLELLTEVGLQDPAAAVMAYPFQLSGGMLQRAMIAAAIAGDPDLLIADEPTTALDLSIQATILELVNSLCRQRQMSLLWISHDLAVVAQVCNQVAVMHQGRIVERGPLRELFANPQDSCTQELLAAVPQMRKNVSSKE